VSKQGIALAERVGDLETGESASSLARESGSEAPPRVPWAQPCTSPFVSIRVIRGSKLLSPRSMPPFHFVEIGDFGGLILFR